ncbi:IgGFc-binding protein-like [Eublepharis macularius]|uniref:IgGFc-binding protein-like n=1 Tax=Eublepharis macularius TaxID=481883 RepID=A0AA97LG61_EUBMA|nr:IgGFc-binding protein-like [Eublepharis macularius]
MAVKLCQEKMIQQEFICICCVIFEEGWDNDEVKIGHNPPAALSPLSLQSSLCSGMSCEKGNVCVIRHEQPQCIPESQTCNTFQCPAGTGCEIVQGIPRCIPYAQSCNRIRCQEGMVCELLDGVPRCVAAPLTCADIRCQESTICVIANNVPQCIPVPLSCQNVRCHPGTACNFVNGWPQCVPIQPSCDKVQCKDGTVCEVIQGQPKCVPAPASCDVVLCERGTMCEIVRGHPKCVPGPPSCRDIKCEVGTACKTVDSFPKCLPVPISCDQIHCKLGTMCELVDSVPTCISILPSCNRVECNPGNVCEMIDGWPNCVPAIPMPSCDGSQCKLGTICEMFDGWPRCVPLPQSCDKVNCKVGTACHIVDAWPKCVPILPSCDKFHCKPETTCKIIDGWPKCVPIPPSCDRYRCKEGTVCRIVDDWPKCIPIPVSCDNVRCKEGTTCQVVDNWPKCVSTPPSCDKYQCKTGTVCKMVDSWPKCVPIPPSCDKYQCNVGTACQVVDGLPRCVSLPQSCANYHCSVGTICQVVDGFPRCVSTPQSCANHHCSLGTVCQVVDGFPRCVSTPQSCANHHCSVGTICQVVDGLPRCVSTPQSCANHHCSGGTICQVVDGFPKCVPMPQSCANHHCSLGTVCQVVDGFPRCVSTPQSCTNYHCSVGTICQVVDGLPRCVSTPQSCTNYHCSVGTICQVVDGLPRCVSIPQSCANHHCSLGTICQVVDGFPRCVPMPQSCANHHCSLGTVCQVVDGFPKCVSTPQSCANHHCRAGTVCQVVDGFPKCVSDPQSCASHHCSVGTICQVADGLPICVSIPQSCANYHCRSGTLCQVVNGFPRCVSSPQSCANYHCRVGTVCQVVDGFPKCVSIPQSCANHHCSVGTICQVVDGLPRCVSTPQSCANYHCRAGTLCQVVDGFPRCVSTPQSCANYHCRVGTVCQIVDGFPKCVSIPQSCASHHCSVGTICQVVDGLPRCVSTPQSCASHHCSVGTICQVVDGLPRCVSTPQSCANYHCRAGTLCQVVDGFPRCVSTPQSCASHHCSVGTVCQVVDGLPRCVSTPQSCSSHHCSVGTICQVVDGLPRCVSTPQSCANYHCSVGTVCQVVDGLPRCVSTPQSCANHHCSVGTICQVVDGLPRCVSTPQSCANYHCSVGTACQVVDGLPRCVSTPQSCANYHCSVGTVCQVVDGLPRCVSTPQSCANYHCSVGTVCQVVDGLPRCVSIPQSCANHPCNVGTICHVVDGLPRCVGIPKTCANHRCKEGTICNVVDGTPRCVHVSGSCRSTHCKQGTVCQVINGWPRCVQAGQPCRTIHCSTGMTCVVVDGVPKCVPVFPTQSACWASGQPHYHTFDGRSYDFQGTCAYTVVKTCKPNSKLPFFHVFTKSQKSSNTPFSFVSQVSFTVYSFNITMVKYEYGLVRVNQLRSRLPISLHNGKLSLYHRGGQLVIETDFGLNLYYDWNYYLVVKATAAFQGHVCGLCGNYNGDPNDDFVTSSGGLATDPMEFGKSWKVEDGEGACSHGCHGKCWRCSPELTARYRGEAFCGLMAKHKDGPFHPCHPLLNYRPYVDNCVSDLCSFDGYKQILCRALKTYADACQREGAAILDWRKQAGCPLSCPENSHYMACGSACPATCSNFDAPEKCHLPCMETCECNPGYVLDSGRCIPRERCGCIYQGQLYAPSEQFWDDQYCHRLCLCRTQDRRVVCQGSQCGERAACRVDNGIRSCYPMNYSTCSTLGQLHYVTFDGLHYDFYGTCVYRLTELCSRRTNFTHFQVLVQHEGDGPKDPSATKVIEVNVYGMTIIVRRKKVLLNGLLINLPYNIEHNKVSLYHQGWDIVIKADFGFTLAFDGSNNIRLTVPGTYTGLLCGLCGNFNGDPDDDMQNRRGVSIPTPEAFGRTWKVRDIPGCTEVEKKECTDIRTVELAQRKGKECGILLDENGPFRGCHSKVSPKLYFRDCVFDYCSTRDNRNVICRIVSSYAAACQAAGAKIDEWRSTSFCRPDCPANSHYEVCASNCPVTCRSLFDQTVCTTQCHEGCECNRGFVLSGDRCVPISQCGCIHQAFYYRVGESFYPNGFCKEQCVCHIGGIMQCQPSSCGPHAECRVVDGVQTCHSLMARTGTCHVFGDPHYLTFDGLTFDIQSNCTYTLIRSCTHKHSTPSFSVNVENERRSRGKVSVTKAVSIIVYQHTFTMMREKRGFVLVNDAARSLPFHLVGSGVRVYYHGDNIILQTDFGLYISFDQFYHLAVTVPHSFQRQVCGLCGNYNGQRMDDFSTPTGDRASSIQALVTSWQVDKSTVCTQDCGALVCGSCNESRKASYVHNSQCGILQAPYGPFSACYSTINPTIFFSNCVHDLCKARGNRVILCRSIHSYVTACQAAGININPWRTQQFCPMKCPANSHYELCAKACPNSCREAASITQCPQTCAEGCECNKGYFMAEYRCVPISLCRCFYNGTWFKVGVMVMTAECKEQCICRRKGRVVCKPYQCSTGRSCVLSNGKWDCVRQEGHCTIAHGDVFTTYDGVSGKVPSVGSYEISSLINTTSLYWFRVVVQLQKCPTCPTPVVVSAIVFFQKLIVRVNQEGLAWVNENPTRLPAQPSKEVSLSLTQGVVTVRFRSDIRVLLGANGEATVVLSGLLSTKVHRACGNFNGIGADDLQLPNGTVANTIGEVLSYWRVRTTSPQGPGKSHP